MTKIPFKPSINHFKTNPSLHHLLVHSKPYLLIYNTSQSILKWGRCVRFTKMTCFPDLLRVKWSHTWMYKLSWVQTTWVRKYTRQAFQRFKPRTKRSSVAPGAALQSFTFWAAALSAQGPNLERSNPKNHLERSSPWLWALNSVPDQFSAEHLIMIFHCKRSVYLCFLLPKYTS